MPKFPFDVRPPAATSSSGEAESFFGIGSVVRELEAKDAAQLRTLLEVSRLMNATLEEQELLPFMMNRLVELMEADHGHLVLLKLSPEGLEGDDGGEAVGWEVRVSVARTGVPGADEQPPSNALIRKVVETREPVRLDDALSDEAIRDSKSAQELGLRSVMATPLICRDRLIGVLTVENRGRFAKFNEEQLEYLQVFGHQAAVALENARLYRSLRDAQAQLSKAHKSLRIEVEESHQALRSERQRGEQLEAELRHMDKMAAMGMMISGIAHELNNPLTGALGFAQLLAMGTNLTERQRQMLGHITSEMTRCAEIIRNLLKFSRKSRFQRTPVDFNQMVLEAVELRRYQFEVNNVKVIDSYDSSIGTMLVDHFQLKGVILNVLNNAYDAIREHRGTGRIELRTRMLEDGQVQVQVSDEGGGIKELDKVFDPFYTTKEVGKGTGLGLSVAFGVVRAHGGTIRAENVGQGAIITVTLPLEAADPLPQEEARPEVSGLVNAGRILVVDDEEVIRELCQALLEGEGFQVDLATEGREAQERIKEYLYDLIITDIRMPGEISGVDLYRWLKQEKPEQCKRVIFITGDLLSQDLRTALGEVGRRLLTKPFEVSALLEVVRHTLKQAEGS